MERNPKTLRLFFSLLVFTSAILVCYLEYGGGYPTLVESATLDSEFYEDDSVLQMNISVTSTETERIAETEDVLPDYPNFPWSSYTNDTGRPTSVKNNCGYYPKLENLEFNNLYWQMATLNDVEYYLYGAYYDNRIRNTRKSTVRVLTMINKVHMNTTGMYCQIWFENKAVVSKAIWSDYIWRRDWGAQTDAIYQPYLIGCQIPSEFNDQIPISVSLVDDKCSDATNNLKVHYNIPNNKKTDFAVCVKGLDFHNDISIKLVEWIELLKLLGASKIYFYNLYSHENIQKILQYYKSTNLVDFTPTTLPGKYPNLHEIQHKFLHENIAHKRLSEVIPYNDCFYRHMYEHKYIALLDIDEIIMPHDGDWFDLFVDIGKALNGVEKSSYSAQNVYFLDEFVKKPFKRIPPYMHMLQHVFRTKEFTPQGEYVKSFHNTDVVLTLHNHYPLQCFSGCHEYEIPTNLAQLQHYREDCVSDLQKVCKLMKTNVVMDTKIWMFKDLLIDGVNRTLLDLDLLPKI